MEFHILPTPEYELLLAEGYVSPNDVDGLSFDEYVSDKGMVESELRRLLSEHWIEEEDYEVAWDMNVALHSCGGVYSNRIVCDLYFQIVNYVLGGTHRKDIWGYHTSIEIDDDVTSECWVRNDIVYCPNDGFPWEKHVTID